jgi:tetratricopeptide (TPR) repeat protein
MYSRSLNQFGVELQRAGDFAKANDYFELALLLNDANASAYVNRDFNRLFRAGQRESERASEGATNRLAILGSAMDAQFSANGPIDEPSVCYLMAQVFEGSRNFRQAAQQIERVLYFSPTNVSARLALVSLLARIPIPDKALELAATLRTEAGAGLTENQMVALIESEAWAYAYKNDLAATEKLLREAQSKYPKQITPWATQLEIYHRLGRFKEATELLNQQLQLQPTNVAALVNFGYLLIQSQQFSNAIPFLDRALALNPKMEQALFNRAIANLRSGRIDAALSDYHTLERSRTGSTYEIYFGLGECYQKKKNLKRAREYYEKYLVAAPPGLPERRIVEDRLKTLDSGAF